MDIDFTSVPQRVKLERLREQRLGSTPYLRSGLTRYLEVSDHYLALNSRTPSQPSGAPSSINW